MISKLLPFLALSIGLGLTAWLVSAATLAAIFHSFAEIGWGIAAIVTVRASTEAFVRVRASPDAYFKGKCRMILALADDDAANANYLALSSTQIALR